MRIAVIDDEKYSRIVLTHQIRQLLPQAEVAQAADWMNNYPRRILGWRSAGAVFEEYVAA